MTNPLLQALFQKPFLSLAEQKENKHYTYAQFHCRSYCITYRGYDHPEINHGVPECYAVITDDNSIDYPDKWFLVIDDVRIINMWQTEEDFKDYFLAEIAIKKALSNGQ